MLGSFPPELVVVSQQPVYSGRRSRRCHVISYRQVTIDYGAIGELVIWTEWRTEETPETLLRISFDIHSSTLQCSGIQQINWRSPLEQVARWKWHVRGNWNPREDRIPSAVWLGILWIGVLFGFGFDAKSFLGQHPPLLLHLHAATYTIWMFLLTAQVLLVVRDRVDLHRKLGWFLAAWACLMGVMGPVGLYTAVMMHVKAHGPGPDPFMSV